MIQAKLKLPLVWVLTLLIASLVLTVIFALGTGRLAIPGDTVVRILLSPLGLEADWSPMQERVVEDVRLPRVLLALIIGAGLAGAGAALQSVFRNPLAEPQLLGVSSGAAFGGVLAFLYFGDGWPVVIGALIFGLLALVAVFWLAGAQSSRSNSTILLVLAGIVISAVFASGVSLIKLVADPQNQLPAIVFWLMGSLSAADSAKLMLATPIILIGLAILYGLRFQLLALSTGDKDASSLGVKVVRVRTLALLAVGLITAASVAVCGVVGWVGLVVPHLVRMAFGIDHRTFLLNVFIAGGIYLILVDTLARSLTEVEIPLGVLTALLGAPLFALLVRKLVKSVGN